jgi:hypothetical protein
MRRRADDSGSIVSDHSPNPGCPALSLAGDSYPGPLRARGAQGAPGSTPAPGSLCKSRPRAARNSRPARAVGAARTVRSARPDRPLGVRSGRPGPSDRVVDVASSCMRYSDHPRLLRDRRGPSPSGRVWGITRSGTPTGVRARAAFGTTTAPSGSFRIDMCRWLLAPNVEFSNTRRCHMSPPSAALAAVIV